MDDGSLLVDQGDALTGVDLEIIRRLSKESMYGGCCCLRYEGEKRESSSDEVTLGWSQCADVARG